MLVWCVWDLLEKKTTKRKHQNEETQKVFGVTLDLLREIWEIYL